MRFGREHQAQQPRGGIWLDNLQCSRKESSEQANIAWKNRINAENNRSKVKQPRTLYSHSTIARSGEEEEKGLRAAGNVAKGEFIPLSQLLVSPTGSRDQNQLDLLRATANQSEVPQAGDPNAMFIAENPTKMQLHQKVSKRDSSQGLNNSYKYLPPSVRKDMSAVYTTNKTIEKLEKKADPSGIDDQLLSSKRVLPIEIRRAVHRGIGQRKSTIPLEKITMLEDSTVSIRPPPQERGFSQKRAAAAKRYSRQPVLTINNVHEKDKEQQRKIEDLLLSHVDTLTRSNESRNFLPQIRSANNSPATTFIESPSQLQLNSEEKQLQYQMMDKYLSAVNSARGVAGGGGRERIKFHDFFNAHGHIEERTKMLEKETLQDKGRRHKNIRLNQLAKRRISSHQ